MFADSRFAARWAFSVLVITCAVLGLMAGVSLVIWHQAPPEARGLAGAICAAVVLLTLPFSVRGYVLTPTTLVIERWGWRHQIALTEVRNITADPEALRGSVRLWASGGLFGYFGIFWSRRLGRFRAYCTAPKRSVVLRLRDRTVVISPDDPTAFIAALEARLPEDVRLALTEKK